MRKLTAALLALVAFLTGMFVLADEPAAEQMEREPAIETTTTTIVAPPTTTTAPPPTTTTQPPAPPTTQPPTTTTTAPAPEPDPAPFDHCTYARQLIAELGVDPDVRIICPGSALFTDGSEAWGTALICGYDANGCTGPEGSGPYISLNVEKAGEPFERWRYTVIHESMHQIHQETDECRTDQIAVAAGADPSQTVYC